jgi:hypothetical protein
MRKSSMPALVSSTPAPIPPNPAPMINTSWSMFAVTVWLLFGESIEHGTELTMLDDYEISTLFG